MRAGFCFFPTLFTSFLHHFCPPCKCLDQASGSHPLGRGLDCSSPNWNPFWGVCFVDFFHIDRPKAPNILWNPKNLPNVPIFDCFFPLSFGTKSVGQGAPKNPFPPRPITPEEENFFPAQGVPLQSRSSWWFFPLSKSKSTQGREGLVWTQRNIFHFLSYFYSDFRLTGVSLVLLNPHSHRWVVFRLLSWWNIQRGLFF